MTPAELKTFIVDAATQHFDERVPAGLIGPLTRDLIIYLMAGFACSTVLKYLPGEDA